MPVLRDAAYPFPDPSLKVLGTVVQKFRPRKGSPAKAFQQWINEIDGAVESRLHPALEGAGLLLDPAVYAASGVAKSLNLALIADFNSLISRSQEHSTPVFALTEEQLSAAGDVLDNFITSRNAFHADFSNLATRIDKMIQDSQV
jgi:hypothetical protein